MKELEVTGADMKTDETKDMKARCDEFARFPFTVSAIYDDGLHTVLHHARRIALHPIRREVHP